MNNKEMMEAGYRALLRETIKNGNEDVLSPVDVYTAGFKAGWEARDEQDGWIPIDEIPDEWRDGRKVDFWLADLSSRKAGCYFSGGIWMRYSDVDRQIKKRATHARLPPQPPKASNND